MALTLITAAAVTVQPIGHEVIVAALSAVGLVLVALIQTSGAKRRVNREISDAPTAPAPPPPPAWNGDPLELNRFIQQTVEAAVEKATEPLRREIEALHGSFRVMRQFVRHLRRAFREYMRDVEASWGKTDRPPKVGADVLAMLYDDDGLDDTLTGDDLRRLRDVDPLGTPERG